MTKLLISILALASLGPTASANGNKAQFIDALLTTYHETGAFNGAVLVADSGTVIFKKGYGFADFEWRIPNEPTTKFRLGSITKQFTATLIVHLVAEGKLGYETTLDAALPYYRKDTGRRITVHQLLNHTSGIPSYTTPAFIRDSARNRYAVREFVEKFCSGDLEFEPGTKYRYNNSAYFILGAIIEEVLKKPYEQALKERVFEPLGMHGSGYDLSAPLLEKRARGYERGLAGVRNADFLDMSIPYAAGSLYSTVEDLYLWDQALYSDRILDASQKERMFRPALDNYGYGWVIRKQPIGPGKSERLTIGHGGGIHGFSTLLTRVPEDRHLIVLLNNTGGTNLGAMSEGITDILYGRVPQPPKRSVASLLYDTVVKRGAAAAVAEYREIRKNRASEFELGEGQLNRLGYELLREKRIADAIEVFTLNVEMFPARANVHDSLGEAYKEAGDKERAVKAYTKALELDPKNHNAKDKLSELAKSIPDR
jgi:CubicO group peptidase (beta-lactamase class C family)